MEDKKYQVGGAIIPFLFDELAQFYQFYVTLWIVLVLRLNDRAADPRLMEYRIEDPVVSYHGGQGQGERKKDPAPRISTCLNGAS